MLNVFYKLYICYHYSVEKQMKTLFISNLILSIILSNSSAKFFFINFIIVHWDDLIVHICNLGVHRFADDIKDMVGFKPGIYWITCWKYIAPLFILVRIFHE